MAKEVRVQMEGVKVIELWELTGTPEVDQELEVT